MPDTFLDSSVLIGLYFRHAGEKSECRKAVPEGSHLITSQYVIFEIARGFLRSLIELHNASFEFRTFSDLLLAAYSGRRRFMPYQMHTWLGAMTDFCAKLENTGDSFSESDKLIMLRSWLYGMVRRGWNGLLKDCRLLNEVSCREDLPNPSLNHLGQLVQPLPSAECGKPLTCGLQQFIHGRITIVSGLASHLESLPIKRIGKDPHKHIKEGLQHLLQHPPSKPFKGRKCHRCGDAIICLEAPLESIIATKNEGDFKPIAEYLGKLLSIAKTAITTKGGE